MVENDNGEEIDEYIPNKPFVTYKINNFNIVELNHYMIECVHLMI